MTVGNRLEKVHQVLMVPAIENRHGGAHERGPRPEAGVGHIDIDNETTALMQQLVKMLISSTREAGLPAQDESPGRRP
jgi:hypothetical protein